MKPSTRKRSPWAPALVARAEILKALAHPARLSILERLAARKSCCCGDLVDQLPLAQATVSQHLAALKKAGLIQGTISGPSVCYCIRSEVLTAAFKDLEGHFARLREKSPVIPESCCSHKGKCP